ncbi:MAG TPA: CYCXC family (seleno)protein [Pyrinomonadaceae bacterium]
MKKGIVIPVLLMVLAAMVLVACNRQEQPPPARKEAARARTPQPPAEPEVPAHYETEPAKGNLAPTLPPGSFTGRTREAYRAVGEMPELIAQMPCYCHCDKGFGHKSLQSCFVDDHAAHCDVCVREALDAYRMRKEQGLTGPQIRERIVSEYSKL